MLYSIHRAGQFVIGVDLGIRAVKAGRIALDGRIAEVRMRDLAGARPQEAAEAVRHLVADLSAGSGTGVSGILGIGLSQPGLVDPDGKRVVLDVHRGWRDVPFGSMLEDLLGVPVFLVEDTRARIFAEMEYGEGKGENHVLYVLIGPAYGKGISAGFESNGSLLDGARGYAGEVGHMVLDPAGPACSCGRRGCWEALGDAALPAMESGKDARGDDGPILRLRSALERGDAEAEASFGRFATVHAEGIANLIHAFNPRLVVIGGKAAALGDRFLSRLESELEPRVMKPFREGLAVRLSTLEAESAIRGAGAAVLRQAIGIRSSHTG